MNKWKIGAIIVIIIFIAIFFLLKVANNDNYKLIILERYNLTESKYNDLRDISNKAIEEVEKQSISNIDIYYARESNFMVVRGSKKTDVKTEVKKIDGEIVPGDITAPSYIYIEISKDSIKTFKHNDKMSFGTETASSYYGDAFANAKDDTEYKNFIYFENLEELQDIIK